MKRVMLAVMLLITGLLLCACSGGNITGSLDPVTKASSTLVPGVDTLIPGAEEQTVLRTQSSAVLYYRCRDEAYLISESRTVTRAPSQSWEYAVIARLLEGPSGTSTGLTRLFPEGTRVLSAVRQGRTLFVTLSKELLNGYSDEPVDWQESETWRRECPLRRRLCMQSLVATVTENCAVDQVQVLVQQTTRTGGSLRLKQNYFLDDSQDNVLVGPMTRDTGCLLTTEAVMDLILTAWRGRDWSGLYLWLISRDPVSGVQRSSQRDFITKMEALPAVVSFNAMGPTFTADCAVATFSVDFELLQEDGSTRQVKSRILRLYLDNGWWKTTYDQLTGWLEVAE